MSLTLHAPLDMHLHLRDGEMLENIAKSSAHTFSGALVMPNLVPPVSSKEEIIAYRQRIITAIGDEKFTPYMTLFFKPSYDKAFLESVKEEITAIKLYPAGITTNSEGGVSGFDVEELRPALEAMSELNIPLCVHGETNGFVMDREAEFVGIYEKLPLPFLNSKSSWNISPPKKVLPHWINLKTFMRLLLCITCSSLWMMLQGAC